MDTVTLRGRLGPMWLGLLAVKLGLGALMTGIGVFALGRGAALEQAGLLVLVGLAVLGAGLYDLWQLTGGRTRITLTPEGLLDYRMRDPRLVPWDAVTTLHHAPVAPYTVHLGVRGLDLSRYGGPGTARNRMQKDTISVHLGHVDVSPRDFFALVQRFAPHVEQSGL